MSKNIDTRAASEQRRENICPADQPGNAHDFGIHACSLSDGAERML
jgi:hypothetical protein